MNGIPSLKVHYQTKKFVILLIIVTLITGFVSCGGDGNGDGDGDGDGDGESYTLIISSSIGGSVTTPGEGAFAYDEGAVVNLVGEAQEGYRFSNWTGDVYTIGNISAALTIIAMQANYIITANFEEIPEAQGTAMVAAGRYHTVGLKSDGTVVAVGTNDDGQCNVGDWTDIVMVAAGFYHTLGFKSDGTVVAAGAEVELAKWDLII